MVQITIDTLQNLGPTLDGTIVSMVISAIIVLLWTIVLPEEDPNAWARFHEIELYDSQKVEEYTEAEKQEMHKALIYTYIWAFGLFVVLCFAWPLLALPAGQDGARQCRLALYAHIAMCSCRLR